MPTPSERGASRVHGAHVGLRPASGARSTGSTAAVLRSRKKGKGKSRARLQIGGQLTAKRAYELRAAKAELLTQKAQATEARIAREAASRARKKLKRLGVIAREQERLRKKRVKALLRAGNPIPPEDQEPILDPEAGAILKLEAGFGIEPASGPGSEPASGLEPELELEPGFEFELDPGSQLARQLEEELWQNGEWEGE
ncbi:hypothetical protein VE04_08836 [Pseudogymnoascus sp. 24MN13]|nr:hypothetical protein VE04_08836 [Pseudogymnoascus sp. 24MN13]